MPCIIDSSATRARKRQVKGCIWHADHRFETTDLGDHQDLSIKRTVGGKW